MNNKEDSSELTEYKNKLSSKLKHLYNDFEETENHHYERQIRRKFKNQMREVFNILIKENIEI